ncbi:uncharacterized protein LOC125496507 [Beta vulgaris subsp. vulgaris]|uniref:uncharacterized protein LOC125496507 n=1 Tax=Beta vulgaris subsp. vulgaris TaxID=3555 RepID=UPI0020371012|nr:uncharacterized protein LOC125496507 [Beta vulgaris subsp. vulgaris]
MVYCSNDLAERMMMWEDLKRLKIRSEPWVICGDFNNVVNFNERVGSNVTLHEVEGIRRCLWDCEVQDMVSVGPFYTWSNKQEGEERVYSKIDRVFVNEAWMVKFEGAKAHFLPESISNHTPCIIHFEDNQGGASKVFRFFNMWTQAAEFEAIVMRGWHKQYTGCAMFKVVRRLKGLKGDLKELNKSKFSNIENEADLAYKKLISIQKQLHSDLRNHELQASESEARRRYMALNQARMSFLQQKVKCEWLKGGDSNTTYFHACLRRRGQNHIYKVKDRWGVWAENQEEIEKAFMEFYKDLLGNEFPNRKKVSNSVLNEGEKLNSRQQGDLCQPFSSEDVKQALGEIEDNKAPSPNGYSSHFFKKPWEVLGEDVTEGVLDFFISGKILKQINNTTLCLIPKCEQPQDTTLDLRKAYDSLDWEFIKEMLLGLKFPENFVNWVMLCVTTPSYSLSINGQLCGFFQGKRGVRQGDPISPLLFVIAMEYFSRLMKKMQKKTQFDFHYRCSELKLSHLIFADDLMLFCKGVPQSAIMIKRVLKTFSVTSGLCASAEKTTAYFGNVKEEIHRRILQVTGIQKGQFPFRYLGVPITSKRISKEDCEVLVDKVLKRMEVCYAKNRGGLGIRECISWNVAAIGKYVWQITEKADLLWIKWIHSVYIKESSWWEYQAPMNASWCWKNICKVKEKMKQAYTGDKWLNTDAKYTIKSGYKWLHPEGEKIRWHNWVWNSFNIPKHSLIAWMAMKGKLKTRDKMLKIGISREDTCALCEQDTEDDQHLFFRCPFSKRVCHGIMQWLGKQSSATECLYTHWKKWGSNYRSKRRQKIWYAALTAVVYEVWRARNNAIWNLKVPCPTVVVRNIKKTVCIRFQHPVTSKWSREDKEWLEKLTADVS